MMLETVYCVASVLMRRFEVAPKAVAVCSHPSQCGPVPGSLNAPQSSDRTEVSHTGELSSGRLLGVHGVEGKDKHCSTPDSLESPLGAGGVRCEMLPGTW